MAARATNNEANADSFARLIPVSLSGRVWNSSTVARSVVVNLLRSLPALCRFCAITSANSRFSL